MDSAHAPDISQKDAEALFQSLLHGERGARLRAQLTSMHPGRSDGEIEEAVQAACKRFVDKAEGITAPGQVYVWLRTTAHRLLSHKAGFERFEIPVDPGSLTLRKVVSEEADPEGELIAGEDEADLARLAREVSSSLSERRRDVLALHGAGYSRPEIASRLGLSESTVKYDLFEIVAAARSALAELSGGGCEHGEPLVLRLACGLASSTESAQARSHLSDCRRCELFSERLSAWREKAGALLPAPAVEQASPGLMERVAHRAAEGLSSVKQQVLGTAEQLKQQASASYYRAVDPTPLAAARPGTVAAVLASCVTIGGGAATYCVNEGVDPIGAATGLIAGTQDPEQKASEPSPEATEVAPVVTPESSPTVEEPVTAETEPSPAEAEPKPQAEPPPPPPEQSFEPSSPNYPATESSAEYQAPESTSAESAEPAPVSGGGAPQFGGP